MSDPIREVEVSTTMVTTPRTIVDGAFIGIATTATDVYVTNGHRLLRFDRATYTQNAIGGQRWNQGSMDGAPTTSLFKAPEGLLVVGSTLYVADSGNSILRGLDMTTNVTSIVAGRLGLTTGDGEGIGPAARYEELNDIAVDGPYAYVADENDYTIHRIEIATGSSIRVAGQRDTYGFADGPALTVATMHRPSGLTVHGERVYFVDEDSHLLRSYDPASQQVVTHAGGAGYADGIGTAARFSLPSDVVSDGTFLYVVDSGNNVIRRVDPTSFDVTTIAGTAGMGGTTDGVGAAARFGESGQAAYCNGALWVTDFSNTLVRRIDLATNAVVTVAGRSGDADYVDGPGATARFVFPYGIACDGARVYVADEKAHAVRVIDIATSVVSTVVGQYPIAYDLDGPIASARTNAPRAVAVSDGKLLVANAYNVRILE